MTKNESTPLGKLMVGCENRVLRKIFVPQMDDVIRGYRKSHNEKGNLSEGDEMGGTCSMHEVMRNAYKTSVGKPRWDRSLGRSKRR
jgi:hypothetical protein